MFNDMNLFHKVVNEIIPVTMPDYLTPYSGDSRLRSTHLDNLSFVSNLALTTTSISYFYQKPINRLLVLTGEKVSNSKQVTSKRQTCY